MKYIYTFLFTSVFFHLSFGQNLFEKSYAFSFATQTYDCSPFFEEGWIMAGYDQVCDYPAVQFIDANGNMIWSHYVLPAGFNYGDAFSVCATSDSLLLVSGFVQLEDDIGFAKGFTARLDPLSGNTLWTQVYDLIPISIIKHPNQNLYLFGFTRTIIANSQGDSLTTFTHDPFLQYDILPDGNLLYCSPDSVCVMDLNGNLLHSQNFPLVRDGAAMRNGQIFLASDQSLLLLDESLNLIHSYSILAYDPHQVFLTASDSGLWCVTVNSDHETSLLRFNDSLQLIFSKTIFPAQPIQSIPAGVELSHQQAAIWGNEVLNNPVNTFIKTYKIDDGSTLPVDADIAVSSVSYQLDSVHIDTIFFPSLNVTWYYRMEVAIENHGNDAIHQFYLSGTKPSSFNCAIGHFFSLIDTTVIPPQGSTTLSFPVSFFTFAQAGYPVTFSFDFCVHAAMPDLELDSFLLNNIFCTLLTGTEEPTELSNQPVIYPNPSDGNFEIRNTNSFHEILMTDLTGNEILRQSIYKSNVQIMLKNLSPGIYVIYLKGEKSIFSGKLFISR